jgi:hypothetical protein
MKIPCSNCNQRLEIPEELAGQTIECPSCKASLAVPAIEVPSPTTPQIRVTAPQAAKPQKPSPRRQTSAAPKAASSKKSKSPIPKWAIAAIVGVVVVVLILMFSSRPTVLILGTTLIIVGSIVASVAAIVLLIANFKKDVVWGLLNFVSCGIPMNVFAIMHFREVKKTYLAYLASMAVAFVGYAITASVAISATGDAVSATVDFIDKHIPDALEQSQSLKPPTTEAPQTQSAEPVAEASQSKPRGAKAPNISIHKAAGAGDGSKANIEAVKQHLAAGTDVDAKDRRDGDKTPLMHAVYWGHKEIVELLVAKGADINMKDRQIGYTSLHWGIVGGQKDVEGQKEIVELLIANGADLNAKAKRGRTPLDLAIQYKKPEIANLLRKHGGKTGEELKADGK